MAKDLKVVQLDSLKPTSEMGTAKHIYMTTRVPNRGAENSYEYGELTLRGSGEIDIFSYLSVTYSIASNSEKYEQCLKPIELEIDDRYLVINSGTYLGASDISQGNIKLRFKGFLRLKLPSSIPEGSTNGNYGIINAFVNTPNGNLDDLSIEYEGAGTLKVNSLDFYVQS